MNPSSLFALTPEQIQSYQLQPDNFGGYVWDTAADEFERPPFMYETQLRFWYNTEDTCYDFHWHNETELIVPLEEGYTVTIQDQPWELSPGDIFLIPPGNVHALTAPPSGARFVFLYETDPLTQLNAFSHAGEFFSEPVLITSHTCPALYEKQISLIMQMASHYWGNSNVRQMHIYACLLEFYAGYTDYRQKLPLSAGQDAVFSRSDAALEAMLENPSRLRPDSAQRLNELLQYIDRHYAEKITLEAAAEMSSLSKFYLTRALKQHTGQTFLDYLNARRIQAAKELLLHTAKPMPQIAKDCGFASISAFNRSFRRLTDCSPSQYRERHGK